MHGGTRDRTHSYPPRILSSSIITVVSQLISHNSKLTLKTKNAHMYECINARNMHEMQTGAEHGPFVSSDDDSIQELHGHVQALRRQRLHPHSSAQVTAGEGMRRTDSLTETDRRNERTEGEKRNQGATSMGNREQRKAGRQGGRGQDGRRKKVCEIFDMFIDRSAQSKLPFFVWLLVGVEVWRWIV